MNNIIVINIHCFLDTFTYTVFSQNTITITKWNVLRIRSSKCLWVNLNIQMNGAFGFRLSHLKKIKCLTLKEARDPKIPLSLNLYFSYCFSFPKINTLIYYILSKYSFFSKHLFHLFRYLFFSHVFIHHDLYKFSCIRIHRCLV